MQYITIVGSRNVPRNIYLQLRDYGKEYALKSWILRSGGAEGCDSAGEEGFDMVAGTKEIYLAWKKENKKEGIVAPKLSNWDKAIEILKETLDSSHFNNLNPVHLKLHGRNVYQILGQDLNTPSNLMICYTLNGEAVGGTKTAILLAQKHNVPIINLGKPCGT